MFTIQSLKSQPNYSEFLGEIRDKIANKTKPLGALGKLETLAEQLAIVQSITGNKFCQKIEVNQPTAIVFAGDHGIAAHNVSIAPSDVTRQMVLNFLHGGAAINCFCAVNNIELKVVDAGIKVPLSAEEKSISDAFIEQRLGAGTKDITQTAAMSEQQVLQGLEFGKQVVLAQLEKGCNFLMFGEMGIANTSAASAIFMALSGQSADSCVGQGTGITAQQFADKKRLINQAVQRAQQAETHFTAKNVLVQLAGFEIVQMVGAILAGAEAGTTMLIDGFIVTSAALVAEKMHPEIKDYLIFSHQSNEHAHQFMLEYFNASPLLSLDLRLGEGTGAALALPLVYAAASFYNDMASFESAGVSV